MSDGTIETRKTMTRRVKVKSSKSNAPEASELSSFEDLVSSESREEEQASGHDQKKASSAQDKSGHDQTSAKSSDTSNDAPDVLSKLRQLEAQLDKAFVSRRLVIRSFLVALVAGEHIVLLGPPGTGKSDLARAFASALGGSYFQTLLTRYSKPEEVFGPVDIRELSQGRYLLKGEGYLPSANVAFLDEIFKANSSILNSLLTALNERLFAFDPAQGMKSIPLQMCIGASNEMPEEDVQALWDRFMFRHWIDYLSSESDLYELLDIDYDPKEAVDVRLSVGEIALAQVQAKSVRVTEWSKRTLVEIVHKLSEAGLRPSDRTLLKAKKALQASAFLRGSNKTGAQDFHILADMLWNKPEDRRRVSDIIADVAFPLQRELTKISDTVVESLKKLKQESEKATSANMAEKMVMFSDFNAMLSNMHQDLDNLIKQQPDAVELIEGIRRDLEEQSSISDELLRQMVKPKRR